MGLKIPQEVIDNMEEGERVVGYTETVFKGTIVMTKKGCGTEAGCTNYMYHSDFNYKRTNLSEVKSSTVSTSEGMFLASFIW